MKCIASGNKFVGLYTERIPPTNFLSGCSGKRVTVTGRRLCSVQSMLWISSHPIQIFFTELSHFLTRLRSQGRESTMRSNRAKNASFISPSEQGSKHIVVSVHERADTEHFYPGLVEFFEVVIIFIG